MEHYQYLMVLAACVAATLPLEFIAGARVYRRPRCTLPALGWVAMCFAAWDMAAARAHLWTYNPAFVVGWYPMLGLPVEELLFFVVVPFCALVTFEAVGTLLPGARQLG
jgi:lycopene beta-cyclase